MPSCLVGFCKLFSLRFLSFQFGENMYHGREWTGPCRLGRAAVFTMPRAQRSYRCGFGGFVCLADSPFRLLVVIFGILVSLGAMLPTASAQNQVYVSRFWHNHQPIY